MGKGNIGFLICKITKLAPIKSHMIRYDHVSSSVIDQGLVLGRFKSQETKTYESKFERHW